MANPLNLVETTVSIAGNKVHFVTLNLFQKFNSHHYFEIVVDFEELDERWMDGAARLIGLIGEPVNITMKQRQTGEENLFLGMVTNVAMAGYHGQQNSIIISGKSPTILLDGNKTMDSFTDRTLQQIVNEAVSNSGNGGSVTSKPEFSGMLGYTCMYNETCFQFLNRLSWFFGEWFYYNGLEIFFGKPGGGDVTDITYDIDMTSFNLSANLMPPKYNRYFYLHNDDKEISHDAPETVPGVQGYLQKSLHMSNKVYTSEACLPLEPVVATKKELEDLLKVEKTRSVGGMLIMSGHSQTCRIKLGESVKIKLPESMVVEKKEVDIFTVTEVTHIVDQSGHYTNSFKGVLSELNNIPMDPCSAPIAGPQLAWVKSNSDPQNKGRVQVQFQWQKTKNKSTNWIKVQTPDAGSSGKVSSNRGLVTIPEEGDTVMVGFEYGDPSRPFTMGSIFTSQTGGGGGQGNKSKSLTTRSGSTISLDDDNGQGSVTISDPSGNVVVLNGDNTISITAPDKITIESGSASIIIDGVANKISISAKDISIEGGETINGVSGQTVDFTAGTELTASAKGNATLHSQAEATLSGTTKAIVTAVGEVALSGAIVKLN